MPDLTRACADPCDRRLLDERQVDVERAAAAGDCDVLLEPAASAYATTTGESRRHAPASTHANGVGGGGEGGEVGGGGGGKGGGRRAWGESGRRGGK
jgi:hypothetical protein